MAARTFFSGFFKLGLRTQLGLLRQYSPKQTPKESQTSEKKRPHECTVGAVQYGAKRLCPVFCVTLLCFRPHGNFQPAKWPFDHSTNWPVASWPVGQLTSWPVARLASWAVSQLADYPIGLVGLADYPIGLVILMARLSNWPIIQDDTHWNTSIFENERGF